MTKTRLRYLLEKQIKSNEGLNKRLGGEKLNINQKVELLYHYITTRYKLEEILDIRFGKDGFDIGTSDGVPPKEFFKLACKHYIDNLFDEDCVNMTSSQLEQYSKDVFNILKKTVAEAVVESTYFFDE